MEKLGFVTMHENSIRTDKFVRYRIYQSERSEYDCKTGTNINTEYKFILDGETEDGEFYCIGAFDGYLYAKEVRVLDSLSSFATRQKEIVKCHKWHFAQQARSCCFDSSFGQGYRRLPLKLKKHTETRCTFIPFSALLGVELLHSP